MGQIAAGGTKKTKAILEAEIAAALAKRNVGIAADANVRFVRPGDRFRYVGDAWHLQLTFSTARQNFINLRLI